MSPRNTNNSTPTSTKPVLPFMIKGTLPEGEAFEFPCGRNTVIKTAKEYMKQGFTGVTIWGHNGTEWVEDQKMTEQAKAGVSGGGNTRGVMALQQLNEHTAVLIRLTSKKQTEGNKEAYDAEIREWVTQFGLTCKALNVTPHVINEVLGGMYQPA